MPKQHKSRDNDSDSRESMSRPPITDTLEQGSDIDDCGTTKCENYAKCENC